MKNIVVFPIDNRPVCYDLIKMISSLDRQNQVFLPDISLLGDLSKVADVEALLDWFEALSDIDYIMFL